ncbi:hypothetical protein BV898_09251 [Hypsibius exemplaris]|uniref:Uncharacterized protein n=1 Tax=Hypsibius exemplaris TaxID=2072580 RepID=A0A1W0WN12_HYPEX|nr:hypothetical protein BV898_09251 [Hypsibius exemplaris]
MKNPVNDSFDDGDSKSSRPGVKELAQKFSASGMSSQSRSSYSFAGPYRPYLDQKKSDGSSRDLRRGASFHDARGQSESGTTPKRDITPINEIADESRENTSNGVVVVSSWADKNIVAVSEFTSSPDVASKYRLRSTLPRDLTFRKGSPNSDPRVKDQLNRETRAGQESIQTFSDAADKGATLPQSVPMLSAFCGKLILSRKLADILTFLRGEKLMVVEGGLPAVETGDQVVLRKAVADYYLSDPSGLRFGQLLPPSSPEESGFRSAAASISPTSITTAQELTPTSTTSSINMDSPESAYVDRMLSAVKFLVKYTDYEVRQDWLDRLLANPNGPERHELGVHVSTHSLQKKLNQYYEGRHRRRLSPFRWELTAAKLRRLLFTPRLYRYRRDLWHILADDHEAKLRERALEEKSGYGIHACPALLDVTKGVSESVTTVADVPLAGAVWCGEKWQPIHADVHALVAHADSYVRAWDAERETETFKGESLNYTNMVDALEMVRTSKMPDGEHSAGVFAGELVHFAEVCFDFWAAQDAALVKRQLAGKKETAETFSPAEKPNGSSFEYKPTYEPYTVTFNKDLPTLQTSDAALSPETMSEFDKFLTCMEEAKKAESSSTDWRLDYESVKKDLGTLGVPVDPSTTLGRNMSLLMNDVKKHSLIKSRSGDSRELGVDNEVAEPLGQDRFSSGGPVSRKCLLRSDRSLSVSPNGVRFADVAEVLSVDPDDIPTGSFISAGPSLHSHRRQYSVVEADVSPFATTAKKSNDSSVSEDRGRKRIEMGKLSNDDRKYTLKDVSSAQELIDRGPCCPVGGEMIYLNEDTHADSLVEKNVANKQTDALEDPLHETQRVLFDPNWATI